MATEAKFKRYVVTKKATSINISILTHTHLWYLHCTWPSARTGEMLWWDVGTD